MNTRLLFIHALSPLHPGTGQSIGAIDLAIARDRATGVPYLPGSSLKGALRGRRPEGVDVIGIFGPDTANANEHSGSVLFGDANLILLPVRSVAGTFAWVTAPYVLGRLARDLAEVGVSSPAIPQVDDSACHTTAESRLLVNIKKADKVVFEDLDLNPTSDASPWAKLLAERLFEDDYWAKSLRQRFCVVSDDVFTFLAQQATDVSARIRMDQATGTVEDGALWYEENLPAESVLASLIMAQPRGRVRDVNVILEGVGKCIEGSVQLGGNATVGRGRCAIRMTGGDA